MEWNNSLFGSVAFEPFCLGEDNLCPKFSNENELLSDYDLYFNGLNSSDLLSNLNPIKIQNDTNANDEIFNLDLDFFTDNSYSLDYFLDGEASAESSPGSFASSGSDNDDFVNKSTLPSPISSIGSVEDLSFDLLESLAADEVLEEKPRKNNVQLFEHMETPLGSPASSSDDDKGLIDLLAISDLVLPPLSPEPSITENVILSEHMYAKVSLSEALSFDSDPMEAAVSDNELTYFDDLRSPKSVDSGISSMSSYDGTSDDSDNLDLIKVPQQASQYVHGFSLENNEFVNSSGNTSNTVRYTPYKAIKKKSPEQRQRKQKQNRNAASKYRTKKKGEVTNVFTEVGKLEEKNTELKGAVDGLRKEIDYLKSLMLDVINARLSKKSNSVNLESLLGSVKQAS